MVTGPFTSQKEFDRVLRAFELVRHRYPSWRLTILGDGPWKTDLRALCEQVGVADAVEMPGEVKDLQPLLKTAGLVICQSCAEDYDSVLCDAMAWGGAVLAIDCQSASREVIRNWVNGVVVCSDDFQALVQGMELLMSREDVRKHLGSERGASSMQRVGLHQVMSMWEALITQVARPDTMKVATI